MARHGKKYTDAIAAVETETPLDGRAALERVKEMAFANFDETVELAVRLVTDGHRVLFTVGPFDDDVLGALDKDSAAVRGIPFFRGSLPHVSEIARRA